MNMSPFTLITWCLFLATPLVLSGAVFKLTPVDDSFIVRTKPYSTNQSFNINDIGSFNEYTDSVLTDVKEYCIVYGLDPIELEDVEEDFEWKVLLITYKGKITLTNGWMQGLSTVYRTADVVVTLTDNSFNVQVPLSLEYLLANYKYSAKFLGLGPEGNVDARITGVQFVANLGLDPDTNDFILHGINTTDLGKVTLTFSGNALTDWILNIFNSVVTKIFNNLIVEVLQGNFSEIFQYILEVINENKDTATSSKP